jgi:hypothetical protein
VFFDMASDVTDVRVVDIKLVLAGGSGWAFALGSHSLLLRVETVGFFRAFSLANASNTGNVIASCTATEYTSYGFYAGAAVHFALLDTHLSTTQNNTLGATLRSYAERSCYQGNEFGDATDCSLFKLFGHDDPEVNEHVVFTDNVVTGNVLEPGWIGVENIYLDQNIENVLVERNWFSNLAGPTYQFIKLEGQKITVRNNIVDASGTGTGEGNSIVHVRRESGNAPLPTDIWIHNNTVCCSTTPSNAIEVVKVESYVTSPVLVTNNIGWCAGQAMDMVFGTGAYTETTNRITQPSFVNESTKNFRLQSGSAAIGAGTTIGVWKDYDWTSRPQSTTWDQGAFERVN